MSTTLSKDDLRDPERASFRFMRRGRVGGPSLIQQERLDIPEPTDHPSPPPLRALQKEALILHATINKPKASENTGP